MTVLSFLVPGFPATQGGMKPVPIKGSAYPRLITTGSAGLEQWRKKVTATAQVAMQAAKVTIIDGKLIIAVTGHHQIAERLAQLWDRHGLADVPDDAAGVGG